MESFDYRMVEVRFDGLSPSSLLNISREARRQDMITVVTGQEDRPVDEFRLAWAGTYATGDLFMVPWDQFNREQVTDPSAPRIFIEPAEMADLTGFVRANALYLDGYEDAAIGGYDLVETRYGNEEPPLTVEGGSGQLSALLRACPGDPAAPLVIHLVEWGSSAPAVIKLRSELLFGSSPVQVRLHIPAAYDAGAHALAETSKDYSSLSVEEELVPSVQGDWTSIQVPALAPWGILVIGKQE